MLHLKDEGDTETTEGHCIYCRQNTTWLITVLSGNWLRFECTRCCKISRDVLVAQ
jgi:hypothetical protein